jgi:excisionase family DNA binding protein
MIKLLFTISEARQALGIGNTLLYETIAAGRLKAVKFGKRTMIEAASLHELIASFPPAIITTAQRHAAKPKDEDAKPAA